MKLMDHITLDFSNKISTDVVFLAIEKAFDTTWLPGLLCMLSKLNFWPVYLKLLANYFCNENSELR
jgi:hypothetical protein